MSFYRDRHGVPHGIQPGFELGEVVFLCEEKVAWCVNRKVLLDSPVLRYTSAHYVHSTAATEVHIPNAPHRTLDVFVRAITRQPLPIDTLTIETVQSAVSLLVRYRCADIARQLVYALSASVASVYAFDLFILCSELGDLASASRILQQGWSWFGLRNHPCPSLLSSYYTRPSTAEEENRLCGDWAMAFVKAEQLAVNCRAAHPGWPMESDPMFWVVVVGEFLRNLQ